MRHRHWLDFEDGATLRMHMGTCTCANAIAIADAKNDRDRTLRQDFLWLDSHSYLSRPDTHVSWL